MIKTFSIFILLTLSPLQALRAQLNVYFLNVGQGDSAYIELPGGSNVLIDGGPSPTHVMEFLMAKGVRAIDHVVLTHPHNDHYSGLEKVFRYFEVRNFYDTRMNNSAAQGDDVLRALAASQPHCALHFPEVGERLNWDPKVAIKVLNSCTEPAHTSDSSRINNCSIVARLYYNGTGLLFTGDIEADQESAITKVFKSGLESQILKVSHHGSSSSSSEKFLTRVKPVHAIISYGLDNNYGHPHAETLLRLQAVGATVYGTQSGNLLMTIPAPSQGGAIDVTPLPHAITPLDVNDTVQPASEYLAPPASAPPVSALPAPQGLPAPDSPALRELLSISQP